ncbi:hypothetical protein HHK36_033413 [Tetracentron sinense]|uniref:Formamidopyrimidine-DNA glycosylase catalytic domain-containing protein n=2 Tax=Magnoliopsida TaxID=3398 RepID=A0A834Y5U7_TETSI|nr:hypothetical protein HHK36_033413 [Tetracentron sinense]
MPELPEVEAARRAIEEHCLGKKIRSSIVADDSKVIDGVSPSDFQAFLLGKTIVSAHRKGKNMWLQLDSPPFPSFQFGMAGAIYIKGVAVTKYKRSAVNDADEWPSKYSKLFIELDDGLEFSFIDKRRFAKVRLLKDPASTPPISELGPDALLEPMTMDEFANSLSKKKIAIKALLLDQSMNFESDEIPNTNVELDSTTEENIRNQMDGSNSLIAVFASLVILQALAIGLRMKCYIKQEFIRCKLLPACPKRAVKLCISALKRCVVIQYAVEVDADCSRFPIEWLFHFRWGKMTGKVNVEVGADSIQFPNNWIFHSREKKPGKAFVDGKIIEFINAGGRTTAYVPELQKLTGTQAGKTPGRSRKQSSKRDVDDEEEPGSEDVEKKGATLKEGQKTTRGGNKKPPAKRKSKESDDDENGDGDQGKTTTNVTKDRQTKVETSKKLKVTKKSTVSKKSEK